MKPSFFKRWIVQPLLNQLKQGVTPRKMALTLALGIALGVFPIIGATTLLCFLAGVVLELNQPTLQLLNYLLYPLQIALVPLFVRAGESLCGTSHMAFSVRHLKEHFLNDPAAFAKRFGLAGLHGIAAWALAAPLVAVLLYAVLLPLLRKMAESLRDLGKGS